MRRMSLEDIPENTQPGTEEHQPETMETKSAEHLFDDMEPDENQPGTAKDEAEGYEPEDDDEDWEDTEDANEPYN